MIRPLSMTVAASLALAGLAVALLAGLMGEGLLATILERALLAGCICFIAGFLIGTLFDGVIRRHAQELRDQALQTEPTEMTALDSGGAQSDGDSSPVGDEPVAVV